MKRGGKNAVVKIFFACKEKIATFDEAAKIIIFDHKKPHVHK